MKKEVFVIPGLITITAFAMSGKKIAKPEPELFWYKVVGTVIDHTQVLNGGNPITRTSLISLGQLPCSSGTNTDCVRGFTNPQSSDVGSGQLDAIMKP